MPDCNFTTITIDHRNWNSISTHTSQTSVLESWWRWMFWIERCMNVQQARVGYGLVMLDGLHSVRYGMMPVSPCQSAPVLLQRIGFRCFLLLCSRLHWWNFIKSTTSITIEANGGLFSAWSFLRSDLRRILTFKWMLPPSREWAEAPEWYC